MEVLFRFEEVAALEVVTGNVDDDDDCFYYFQQYFSILVWGSMKFKSMGI